MLVAPGPVSVLICSRTPIDVAVVPVPIGFPAPVCRVFAVVPAMVVVVHRIVVVVAMRSASREGPRRKRGRNREWDSACQKFQTHGVSFSVKFYATRPPEASRPTRERPLRRASCEVMLPV
mgnify:CR=1 FL=1